MKHLTLVCPCYNEEANINEVHRQITAVFALPEMANYTFDICFVDNHSTDKTRDLIRALAAEDPRVKAIFNARNFGHIRSPFHGMVSCLESDAIILIASDLQDPPEVIVDLVKGYEEGYRIVIAQKNRSKEGLVMKAARAFYYRLIKKISTIDHINQFTGFGLYDRSFVMVLSEIEDPYPYFRGLIAELGFDYKVVNFTQPRRERGKTKNNWGTLYDMAMLGITSYSKRPLRMATKYGALGLMFGLPALIALIVLKVLHGLNVLTGGVWAYWSSYELVLMALMVVSTALILFFIGIHGEYTNFINQRLMRRPHVVEEERINF